MVARGYDGEVRIDSRIDTAGFNKGISKIGSSLKNVAKVLGVAAIGMAVGFVGVLFVISSIVRGLISLGKTIFNISKDVAGYGSKVEELKSTFDNLKLAVADAFRPLITFALPWIQQVVSWVQNLLSLIAQVTAGLTGQTGYWKTTAKEASSAANATNEVAKNTKKAGEAAEGALASFDDLNVLQMAKEEDTAPTGSVGGTGAATSQEWVPLGEKAIEIIDQIESLKQKWGEFKQWFIDTFSPMATWMRDKVWLPISNFAVTLWTDRVMPAWESIKRWFTEEIFNPLRDKFLETMTSIREGFDKVFRPIIDWLEDNLGWRIENVLNLFKDNFKRSFEMVINIGKDLLRQIRDSIEGIMGVLDGLITFITGVFTGDWDKAWKGVKKVFTSIFETLGSTVKNTMNIIIEIINGLMQGFTNSVNTLIENMLGMDKKLPFGIKLPFMITKLVAPKIPRLATGAVIPPNAAFLAMLGDQRHGTNIEAPEELIRQIVREETGGGKEVTINFAGSLGALVRELKPYIDKENGRIGRSLVSRSAL